MAEPKNIAWGWGLTKTEIGCAECEAPRKTRHKRRHYEINLNHPQWGLTLVRQDFKLSLWTLLIIQISLILQPIPTQHHCFSRCLLCPHTYADASWISVPSKTPLPDNTCAENWLNVKTKKSTQKQIQTAKWRCCKIIRNTTIKYKQIAFIYQPQQLKFETKSPS